MPSIETTDREPVDQTPGDRHPDEGSEEEDSPESGLSGVAQVHLKRAGDQSGGSAAEDPECDQGEQDPGDQESKSGPGGGNSDSCNGLPQKRQR